jgi:hypothetical protein
VRVLKTLFASLKEEKRVLKNRKMKLEIVEDFGRRKVWENHFFCFRTDFQFIKGGRLIRLVRRGIRTGQALFFLEIEPDVPLIENSFFAYNVKSS